MRIHSLLSRPVDDGVLVFDLATGSTHLLDFLSWNILNAAASGHSDSSLDSRCAAPPADHAAILENLRRCGLCD